MPLAQDRVYRPSTTYSTLEVTKDKNFKFYYFFILNLTLNFLVVKANANIIIMSL